MVYDTFGIGASDAQKMVRANWRWFRNVSSWLQILAYLYIPQRLEVLHSVKMWLNDVSVSIVFRTTQLQDQLQSQDN